jgi:phosphoglycolate phosphatase-like HAD superfamily hydrolase
MPTAINPINTIPALLRIAVVSLTMSVSLRIVWHQFPDSRAYTQGEMIHWSAEVYGEGEHFGDVWVEEIVEIRRNGEHVMRSSGGGYLPPSALQIPSRFGGSRLLTFAPGEYEFRTEVHGSLCEPLVRSLPIQIVWPEIRAVALDFGHTVIDERLDVLTIDRHDEAHLMPGARDALGRLQVPVAIWANTRVACAADIRAWLERAGISDRVQWVVTSVEAKARKPNPEFFRYALRQMGLDRGQVLFVGNQSNADIIGAAGYGIRSVYLADAAYRSADDRPCEATPDFTIQSLHELPELVERLV